MTPRADRDTRWKPPLHTVQRGQVYRSCNPAHSTPTLLRVESYRPGDLRAEVAEARTGRRRRQLRATQLHGTEVSVGDALRRTGYALVRSGLYIDELLLSPALNAAGHSYELNGRAVADDPRRGGYIRLAGPATVALCTGVLAAAGWHTDPEPLRHDGIGLELRIRVDGDALCPALGGLNDGEREVCFEPRGHRGDHCDLTPIGRIWWAEEPDAGANW